MNVHEISDVPINYKTKHDLHELNPKFSNLDINSNTELIHSTENKHINFDEYEKESEKSDEDSFAPFYSSSSSFTPSSSSKQHKLISKKLGKDKYKKLSNKKMCSKALELIKFLGTLQMKKLELNMTQN